MPALALSASETVREQGKRAGPLALIVLLHIGFFLALRSDLSDQTITVHSEPREIVAGFIMPAPAPSPGRDTPPAAITQPAVSVKKQPRETARKKQPSSRPLSRAAPPDHPSPLRAPPQAPAEPAAELPAPAATRSAVLAPSAVASPAAAPSAPVPAPQAAAPAAPKTVSGVEYIQPPQPEYPSLSRRMREEGKVLLRILVDAKGRPERVEIQKPSGSARLDEAARQAAGRALFKPHLEDGRPVAVFALVPINFSLQ